MKITHNTIGRFYHKQCGDDFVVFDERQQKIFLLDQCSSKIWLHTIVGRKTIKEAASLFANDFSITEKEAANYIGKCMDLWDQQRIFKEYIEADPVATSSPTGDFHPPAPAAETFRIGGVCFGFNYASDSIRSAIREVFGHLLGTQSKSCDVLISTNEDQAGYCIQVEGQAARHCSGEAAVAVHAKEIVLDALLAIKKSYVAFHAAAVTNGDTIVMIAGPSGSGKSTLAALLNRRGWDLIADDAVILDARTLELFGLPLAFAAKSGSWELLEGEGCCASSDSPRRRPDGKLVRYFWPRFNATSRKADPAIILIIPEFGTSLGFRSNTINSVDMMLLLLSESKNSDRRLAGADFHGIAAMISKLKGFNVSYNNAHEVDMWLKHMQCR